MRDLNALQLPVADPPAAQRVLRRLREMIVRGELAPGARIVERALCVELSVSRTPMREALKLLEIDGLVELSQNRGARVRSFSELEARELFEVLSGIESHAAELATERMTRKELARVKDLHSKMAKHCEASELDPYFDLNTAIHEMIVGATENSVLINVYENLMLRARRGRYMAILDHRRWEQSMEEHEALVDALDRRNAADAGRIWRTHLMRTGHTVARVLKRDAARLASAGPKRAVAKA